MAENGIQTNPLNPSGSAIDFLFIVFIAPLCGGLCVGLLVCGVVLCALFSLVVIVPRKIELAASILLCYSCMCSVSLPHGAMVSLIGL